MEPRVTTMLCKAEGGSSFRCYYKKCQCFKFVCEDQCRVYFQTRKETKMFIEEIQRAGIVFKAAVTFFYLDLQSYCC